MKITEGVRKVWVVLGTFCVIEAIATFALFFGKLSSPEWVTLNEWIAPTLIGLFVAGNLGEHFARPRKAAAPGKPESWQG